MTKARTLLISTRPQPPAHERIPTQPQPCYSKLSAMESTALLNPNLVGRHPAPTRPLAAGRVVLFQTDRHKENEPTLPAPGPMTIPDAPRECGVPTPPCSVFRLLSSPAHSQHLAIRSGQSHPGLHADATASSPAAVEELANAFARSDDPAASGESAPSVTLPPASLHAIVWCGDTPAV